MAYKVFVDGQEGTTGLEILQRLESRSDIELLRIDPQLRKDPAERRRLIHASDITFLCLPDEAARESAILAEGSGTCVIDASTAHRTAPGWVYGLPELSPAHRLAVRNARKIANPGCHATGFNVLIYPLVASGILSDQALLSCTSLTGYSGAGKKMIAEYEANLHQESMMSPRMYATGLAHKHLPEMKAVTGLKHAPVFTPVISPVYKGMVVSVPIHTSMLAKPMSSGVLQTFFSDHYAGSAFVRVMPYPADKALDNGFLPLTGCNGTNRCEIFVFGHGEQTVLSARFDNLGKGASGAAVQSMNIVLGLDETSGLV